MYLADYHTHSRVSPDGHASMLEMASAAAAAGLNEICFTDHFEPTEPRTTIPRKTFDWSAQTVEYADVTARWNGPVKLRLGLELGDTPFDAALVERLLGGMPEFDFIIGSVHMLSQKFDHQDLAWIQEPDEETCYAEVEDYLETMLKMARWGKFSVLGHMTLPLRYMNDKRGFRVSMDPNTKATAKRTLTLTFNLTPDDDRANIGIDCVVKSKLASTNPVTTSLFITGRERTGEVRAVENVPQIPGQTGMDGSEQESAPMLKLVYGGI